MRLNDGSGLYDNHGLIAKLTQNMNSLADATGVAKCVLIIESVNLLKSLDTALVNEEKQHEEQIKELEALIPPINLDERTVKDNGQLSN